MAERDDVIDPLLLAATKHGHRLFRNNQGVAFHRDGSTVAYGVGKGGSDTIGWVRLVGTQEMVGRPLAIFCAIEAKTGRQRPSEDQKRFLRTVREAGGISLWGNDPHGIMLELEARIRAFRGEL